MRDCQVSAQELLSEKESKMTSFRKVLECRCFYRVQNEGRKGSSDLSQLHVPDS